MWRCRSNQALTVTRPATQRERTKVFQATKTNDLSLGRHDNTENTLPFKPLTQQHESGIRLADRNAQHNLDRTALRGVAVIRARRSKSEARRVRVNHFQTAHANSRYVMETLDVSSNAETARTDKARSSAPDRAHDQPRDQQRNQKRDELCDSFIFSLGGGDRSTSARNLILGNGARPRVTPDLDPRPNFIRRTRLRRQRPRWSVEVDRFDRARMWRALSRPWSASIRLFASCSVS
jgi:hypothetical protein